MKYFPWSGIVAGVVALGFSLTVGPWLGAPREAAGMMAVVVYFNILHCIEGLGK